MGFIVFVNPKDLLVGCSSGLTAGNLNSALIAEAGFAGRIFAADGQVAEAAQAAAAAEQGDLCVLCPPNHPSFRIQTELDRAFGIRRILIGHTVLRRREDPSRAQLDRALESLHSEHFDYSTIQQDIDVFQKTLLNSLWSKLDIQGLGKWVSRLKKIFAADQDDQAKDFVKQYFPASSVDEAIKAFRAFVAASDQAGLKYSDETLAKVQSLFREGYSLAQEEPDLKLHTIKTLLQQLIVLVGTDFIVNTICRAGDTAAIVSADEGDRVRDVPFVKVELPLATAKSSDELYKSPEYFECLIQQYLALGISPAELLTVLHDNGLFKFKRATPEMEYCLKLIDCPVVWKACAHWMLKKQELSSQLSSIINCVVLHVFHDVKASSALLEKLQQISVFWLKIPNIFEILGIGDAEDKHSRALLLLAAVLKNANLFNTSLQLFQSAKCARFAKYFPYMSITGRNVRAEVISPVTGQQGVPVQTQDIIASVFSYQQLNLAIVNTVSQERFRFNSQLGLEVFIATDDQHIDPAQLVISTASGLQMLVKNIGVKGLIANPLSFDPSFITTSLVDAKNQITITAVATEELVDDIPRVRVWGYNLLPAGDGSADFIQNYPSFTETNPKTLGVVYDRAIQNGGGGAIHVLRVTAPSDCAVIYLGGGNVRPEQQLPQLNLEKLFQDCREHTAEDPYLLSDVVLPLIKHISSLNSPVDRYRALLFLATFSAESGQYYRYLRMTAALFGANGVPENSARQWAAFTESRRLLAEAVLQRGSVVRRTIDGKIVNLSDEKLRLYKVLVFTTALIFPHVYRPFTDDQYLDEMTSPALVQILIKTCVPIFLMQLVLVFGDALPLLYRLLAESWVLLQRVAPRLFDRRIMQADVKHALAEIEASPDAALILRLAEGIIQLPCKVSIGSCPDHPYLGLAGFFRVLSTVKQDPLAHHLLVTLTSRASQRRDIGRWEYQARTLLLRPAYNIVLPAALLALVGVVVPGMHEALYSDAVQDSSTKLITFFAVAGILLNTPGAPLGLAFITLLYLIGEHFEFDFFKLTVIDKCLDLLAQLLRPVVWCGNGLGTCVRRAGLFSVQRALRGVDATTDEQQQLLPQHGSDRPHDNSQFNSRYSSVNNS